MIFLLKPQGIKKFLFPIIILLFAFSGLAQNGVGYSGFEEEEDIACEDLPEALDKYIKDTELNQLSSQKALMQTAGFLKTIAESEKFSREKLLEMINSLEDAYYLSQENIMLLSDRAYNISYFLEECLKPEEE